MIDLSPNNQSTRAKLTHVVILLLVSGLALFIYGRIDYTDELYSKWDLQFYRAMAAASPSFTFDVHEPFVYRILGPYLVGLLPVSDVSGFYAFTVIASACLVVLYYLFLCRFGIRANIAFLITVLFILNKSIYGFMIWDYFQIIDWLGLICLVGLFWMMLEKRWGGFCLIMVLGSLAREYPILMIPVTFVYLAETGALRNEWWKVALAVVPGIVVFVCLRLFIEPSGGLGLAESFMDNAAKKLGSCESWYRAVINAYAPFSLLPLIFARDMIELFRSRKYMLLFVLLVWLSSLFGNNHERLQSPTFIVFYLAVAYIIQKQLYSYRSILVIFVVSTFARCFGWSSALMLLVVSAVSIVGWVLNAGRRVA